MRKSNTSFKDNVYKVVRKIPKGKVATYGQVALLAGNKNAARAVGALMRTNPNPIIVPCHRVVSVNGELTGYSANGGVAGKRKLLVKEGVGFIGKRVDLSKYKM